MKILIIGDVVSSNGCEYLREVLPNLKKEFNIDVAIVNGENSAVGNGVLPNSANHILDSGANVVTTGNHSLKRREVYDYFDSGAPIIRPCNYHKSAPGKGMYIIDKGFAQVAVINVQGAVYMEPVRNPFDIIDDQIQKAKDENCKIIIVDFHAEATAEKRSMGFYLDGRVSAVVGTHTHVQTSDAQILPKGTAYITDLGMTGVKNSVLGITAELAIEKLRTNLPTKFANPDGECIIEGCVIEIDNKTGLAVSIKAIRR